MGDKPNRWHRPHEVAETPSLPRSQTFTIEGKLPGMNEIARKHWAVYVRLKKQTAALIFPYIRLAKIRPMQRASVTFEWFERDRSRDWDNIVGFATKIVLDTLVACEILPDDGWDHIEGISHRVTLAERYAVRVTLWGD